VWYVKYVFKCNKMLYSVQPRHLHYTDVMPMLWNVWFGLGLGLGCDFWVSQSWSCSSGSWSWTTESLIQACKNLDKSRQPHSFSHFSIRILHPISHKMFTFYTLPNSRFRFLYQAIWIWIIIANLLTDIMAMGWNFCMLIIRFNAFDGPPSQQGHA